MQLRILILALFAGLVVAQDPAPAADAAGPAEEAPAEGGDVGKSPLLGRSCLGFSPVSLGLHPFQRGFLPPLGSSLIPAPHLTAPTMYSFFWEGLSVYSRHHQC